jgi:hypothetical protein
MVTNKGLTRIVRVARTTVGQGVFAERSFRARQTIGRVAGDVIADPEYASDYCMELAEGEVLEPFAPFRFLNHSCEPNCELVVWHRTPQVREMWLQAIRTIHPGHELTIDYAWPASDAIPCSCQSASCRGWIVDLEELDWLPRRRRRAQKKGR